MSRRRKDPLRALTEEECSVLVVMSRAQNEPASHVARAKMVLAVADGKTYQAAAFAAGHISNDAVSKLISRFNKEGVSAPEPRHGTGPVPTYGPEERKRILSEFHRQPERQTDGTATWSLTTLRQALRQAPDGLPRVSTYTIWKVLHEAGMSWQKDRTWCETGKVKRKRKSGTVEVQDPDTEPKKKLIEDAYTLGPSMRLDVRCHDHAGPYQTVPQPGSSWAEEGKPARHPAEYVRKRLPNHTSQRRPWPGRIGP